MQKKNKSTFAKITTAVVWIMIIVTIGGILLSALASLGVF